MEQTDQKEPLVATTGPAAPEVEVRHRRSGIWFRLARAFGWGLLVAGLGLLGWLGYQLWGTGLEQSRSQDELRKTFEGQRAGDQVIEAPAAAVPEPGIVVPASLVRPAEGDVVGRLRIPAIGVDQIIVEGVGEGSLRRGPGHYPTTALPGLGHNAAIAGHRTTYGAPFNRIHELQPGDQINVEMVFGSFTYEVVGQGDDQSLGHFIVKPNDVWVLGDAGDNRLTLTSCHPMHSARERIVVVAELVGEPAVVESDVMTSQPGRT